MHCEIVGKQCIREKHPNKCGGCYFANVAASSAYEAAKNQIGRGRVAGVIKEPEGNDFSARSDESVPVTDTLIFTIIGDSKEYEGEGLETIQAPKSWFLGRKRFPILMRGNITGGKISLTNYAP